MVVVVVDAMVVSSFLHPCPTILAVVAALCELPKKVHTGYTNVMMISCCGV